MYVCFDLFFPNTVSEGQFYKTPKLDHYFLDLNISNRQQANHILNLHV